MKPSFREIRGEMKTQDIHSEGGVAIKTVEGYRYQHLDGGVIQDNETE